MSELLTCKHCESVGEWEGMTDKYATLWSCENCGEIFCDNCVHINNEEDDVILCADCRKQENNGG